MKYVVAAAAAAVLVSACQTVPPHPLRATAELQPTKGSKTSGVATFEQVNGKVRARISIPADSDEAAALAAARAHERISEQLAGKTIIKEIVVPGRLVSFVIR